MSEKISIVAVQTTPGGDRASNLNQAVDIMEKALYLHKHVDIVVLPENFYFFPSNKDKENIGPMPEEILKTFSYYAKTFNTHIVAGSVVNRRGSSLYNTSMLFNRNGEVVGSYDKIHLFDVLNGEGGKQESDLVSGGENLLIYDADFGRMATMICYDIRFPELSRTLALKGVQYLFVPAAFYMPRFDHWQKLLQSIALQNSMYVAGANLYGKIRDEMVFCGRSLIADPWGISVATASDKPGFIQAYVDKDYCSIIKDSVGTIHNRVPSVYNISVVEKEEE